MKYHLHIKFKKDSNLPQWVQESLNGDYEVVEDTKFQTVDDPTDAWLYAFVSIRKNIQYKPVAGCSILNPHDTLDDNVGVRNAFKRAVEALWIREMKWVSDEKLRLNADLEDEVIDKFRYARYNALKQLNAEKEK